MPSTPTLLFYAIYTVYTERRAQPPHPRQDPCLTSPRPPRPPASPASSATTPRWSVFWDKRYGLWRAAEDDPDSDLYAEAGNADTVIQYMTAHS